MATSRVMTDRTQHDFNEPAASIVALLGGVKAVCAGLNLRAETTVYRWMYSKDKGGRDGFIPRWYHDDIIAMAAKRGIELTKPDFVIARALTRDDLLRRSMRLSVLAV